MEEVAFGEAVKDAPGRLSRRNAQTSVRNEAAASTSADNEAASRVATDNKVAACSMAPPLLDMPPASLSSPFLCSTDPASALPAGLLPRSIDELEALGYLYSGQPLPELCIVGRFGEHETEDEVRAALARCERMRLPWWLTVRSDRVGHPAWWPAGAEEVTAYRSLIVGVGASGIGMHRDAFNRRLCSTYIALGAGRKRVVLLPHTAEATALATHRFGARDPLSPCEHVPRVRALPPRPAPELLAAVSAAGGFWFELRAAELAEEGSTSANTVFIPAGWWHWLAGAADGEWHVAWAGSFFPPESSDCDKN